MHPLLSLLLRTVHGQGWKVSSVGRSDSTSKSIYPQTPPYTSDHTIHSHERKVMLHLLEVKEKKKQYLSLCTVVKGMKVRKAKLDRAHQ